MNRFVDVTLIRLLVVSPEAPLLSFENQHQNR